MLLVKKMKKIMIKENDANQRIDKYLKKLCVMRRVILFIKCLEKKILRSMAHGSMKNISYKKGMF